MLIEGNVETVGLTFVLQSFPYFRRHWDCSSYLIFREEKEKEKKLTKILKNVVFGFKLSLEIALWHLLISIFQNFPS